MEIYFNINGRNQHVPATEQFIEKVKEWAHAIANQLPFEKYPHRLIVEMVYNIMF